MKKTLISILSVFLILIIAIFLYRYRIAQYSIETIIRKSLPGYLSISKIKFDFQAGKVLFNGLKILNPGGFSDKYMLEVDEVSCSYKMKSSNILDGFEIRDPVVKRPVLNIERLSSGRLNLASFQEVLEREMPRPQKEVQAAAVAASVAGKKASDVLRLPAGFDLKNGRIIFIDRLVPHPPHMMTFENINSRVSMRLNDVYSKVLDISSSGRGNINANKAEVVEWSIVMDATAPKLTMSNRFNIMNVDIVSLEPYYDKYSPFVFKAGRVSGTLVFDFDSGIIGSTNELHLSGLIFAIKPGYENASFWETTVPDLVKYFSNPYGEIVFDFKVKGDPADPKFYLGPISKQALAAMAIDKISAAIERASGHSGDASGEAGPGMGKAKDYIDLFKGLMNKK